jgi:predicted glycogen debranching enzyme
MIVGESGPGPSWVIWQGGEKASPTPLLEREWLATNGLGGYASSSLAGVPTRSYHGLLIAALPAPWGRLLLLNGLIERVGLPDGTIEQLGGIETTTGSFLPRDAVHLREFRLDAGLPVWRYALGEFEFEKRIWMPHWLNTTFVTYRLLAGDGPLELELMPMIHRRSYGAPVSTPLQAPMELHLSGQHLSLSAPDGGPVLRLEVQNSQAGFTSHEEVLSGAFFRVEHARGYTSSGEIFVPGSFTARMTSDDDVILIASTEDVQKLKALPAGTSAQAEQGRRHHLLSIAQPALRDGVGAELVLAADQFLIYPVCRAEEATRLRAAGDDARTVIAGYHWFTDWGRDTMISLEGLTLPTGRHAEARYILHTFAEHIRDGLIPNYFPDGQSEGVYHTADATLWFFHALHRYTLASGEHETLDHLLPGLCDIVQHHIHGTRFGIGVDLSDGLLCQGAKGYQLTWMDAKVGDWVVTPRRGKAVEINALWYNALCLLHHWLEEEGGPRDSVATPENLTARIDQVRESFNKRFWAPELGYLYDVVDGELGDDPACRPNQLFAISLDHPVLDRARWPAVLEQVQQRLLTPVGLRSLAPGHPDYKARYDGDLRARDAAYHQGTVWAWLIGPFVDAWIKVHPARPTEARRFLAGLVPHLAEAGVGSISEIFDAEPPFVPRGCIAQAWSVAEMLRAWGLTQKREEAEWVSP